MELNNILNNKAVWLIVAIIIVLLMLGFAHNTAGAHYGCWNDQCYVPSVTPSVTPSEEPTVTPTEEVTPETHTVGEPGHPLIDQNQCTIRNCNTYPQGVSHFDGQPVIYK